MVFRSLYEDITQNEPGHVLDSISHCMMEAGTLSRERGGPKDKVDDVK